MTDEYPADAKEMIEEINRAVSEDEFDLSEWEAGFIESIGRQIQAGRSLSEKQDEILEKIWKKANS